MTKLIFLGAHQIDDCFNAGINFWFLFSIFDFFINIEAVEKINLRKISLSRVGEQCFWMLVWISFIFFDENYCQKLYKTVNLCFINHKSLKREY